jgi:hypothetical protein
MLGALPEGKFGWWPKGDVYDYPIDTKDYFDAQVRMMEGKFRVIDEVQGMTIALSELKMLTQREHVGRELIVSATTGDVGTFKGQLFFEYGSHRVTVQVQPFMKYETIVNRIKDSLIRQQGGAIAMNDDRNTPGKSAQQVRFELPNL